LRRLAGLALVVIALLGTAPVATASPSSVRIRAYASTELRSLGGRSGAWAIDLTTGRRLLSVNASRSRTPASVEKLLTSSTALALMGAEERIPTALLSDGPIDETGALNGNLYVKGYGDPSLSQPAVEQLADEVVNAGIAKLAGRIYGDESYFDGRRGLAEDGFRISPWLGPLSALSLDGGRAVAGGRASRSGPAVYASERLRRALEDRGVEIGRSARLGRAPPGATELGRVFSAPLSALVRHMNQISDNYYAEVLVKGLGARFGAAGSTAAGAKVVRKYQAGFDVRANVVDGSGLSRGNAVSPRSIGRLLDAASGSTWFDNFYRSLPLAGRTGTLRKRMRGGPAAGRCRAKTGTLIGVSALAGYCRSRAGHRIAFSVLMNGIDVYRARLAQDRIAAALARSRTL
jgi:D-alanyl-D-alanine carboxypeptidase/D-alanyl-D-alanine-endopeptidase (penicillin-binding protein 4)